MVFAYFTPVTGLLGGSMIGLSAASVLILSGDILGSSGLVSSILLNPKQALTDTSFAWKLVFHAVFMLLSTFALGPYFTNDKRLGNDDGIPVVSDIAYVIGGFLVGIRTRLGNGCTIGHGVCGIAWMSPRSWTAVMTFMASAMAVAALTSSYNKATADITSFLRTSQVPMLYNCEVGLWATLAIVVPTAFALGNLFMVRYQQQSKLAEVDVADAKTPLLKKEEKTTDQPTAKNNKKDNTTSNAEQHNVGLAERCQLEYDAVGVRKDIQKLLPATLSGALFAVGLAVSGMVLPSKVIGFLSLYTIPTNTYDPTLATVMGGAVLVSFVSYQFIEGWSVVLRWNSSFLKKRPSYVETDKFSIPTNRVIDWKLVIGAFLFGAGWAISSLCPGPALFLAATGTTPVIIYWWPSFMVGLYVATKIKEHFSS